MFAPTTGALSAITEYERDESPSLQDEVLEEIVDVDPAMVTPGEVMEVFGGGLHGAEHGMTKLTPLELRMDTSDLSGLSTPAHEETGVPTWFIHDAVHEEKWRARNSALRDVRN